MKKISSKVLTLTNVLTPLYELRDQLSQEKYFNSGVLLGELMTNLTFLLSREIENIEKKEEEDEEEVDHEVDAEYWKECHGELKEQIDDYKKSNKLQALEIHSLKEQLNSLRELIKKLLNADQIHPNQRQEAKDELLKTGQYEDGCLGRIVDKK